MPTIVDEYSPKGFDYSVAREQEYMTEAKIQESTNDLGLIDNVALGFKAAGTGLAHGALSGGPESFYRSVRTLGRITGSQSWQDWADTKLQKISYERQTDPFYKVDPEIMQDSVHRSLYEGMSSLSSSLETALPGLAVGLATGGAGWLGLLAFGLNAGSVASLAEFDNFMDQAYTELGAKGLSKEDIDSSVWNEAVWSAFAEGGLEAAGNILGGKLIGAAGKPLGALGGKLGVLAAGAGEAGGQAYYRSFAAKFLKNTLINGVFAEVPTEMATAMLQDETRKWAGLSHQGKLEAMKQAFGPALVASLGFGAAGTVVEHNVTKAFDLRGKMEEELQKARDLEAKQMEDVASFHYQRPEIEILAKEKEKDTLTLSQTDSISQSEAVTTSSTDKVTASDTLTEAESHVYAKVATVTPENTMGRLIQESGDTSTEVLQGIYGNINDPQVTADFRTYVSRNNKLPSALENRLSTTEKAALKDTFRNMKTRLLDSIDQAYAAGVIPEETRSKYGFLNEAPKLPTATELSQAVDNVFDYGLGKKDLDVTEDNLVNTGFHLNIADQVYTRMGSKAMESFIERVRAKEGHRAEDLIREARAEGWDPQVLSKMYGLVGNVQNADHLMVYASTHYSALGRAAMAQVTKAAQSNNPADLTAAKDMMGNWLLMGSLRSAAGTGLARGLNAMKYSANPRKTLREIQTKLVQALDKDPSAQRVLPMVNNILIDEARSRAAKTSRTTATHRDAVTESIKRVLSRKRQVELTHEEQQALKVIIREGKFSERIQKVMTESKYGLARNALIESVTNGLLSSPKTLIRNTLGNTWATVAEVYNRAMAPFMIESKFGVEQGESKAMMAGLFYGFRDALNVGWKTFRVGKVGPSDSFVGMLGTQEAQDYLAKRNPNETNEREFSSDKAISGANALKFAGMDKDLTDQQLRSGEGLGAFAKYLYKTADGAGTAINLPGRTMLGTDEFFKVLAYSMERHAQAFRASERAKKLGLTQEEYYQMAIEDGSRGNTDHIEAMNTARQVTFQDELGPLGEAIENVRNKWPMSRMVVPFFKTGINILKYGAVRTPGLANLFSEYRDALSSGDPAKAAVAEARVLTGTMFWYGAIYLAASGMLTGGGPKDKEERDLWRASGWQPNSVKIGDTWVELNSMDPVASFFVLAANYADAVDGMDDKSLTEATSALFGASLKMAGDKYYFSGITNFLNGVMDYEKDGGRWIDQMAPMLVPYSSGLRWVTNEMDPVMRESHGVLESILKITPGMSETLAPRRTILGDTHAWDPKFPGSHMMAPSMLQARSQEPVYGELYRLRDKLGTDFAIGRPRRTFSYRGQGYEMNAQQYSQYLQLVGQGTQVDGMVAKDRIAQLIQSPAYQQLEDTDKGHAILNILNVHKQMAKKTMLATMQQ